MTINIISFYLIPRNSNTSRIVISVIETNGSGVQINVQGISSVIFLTSYQKTMNPIASNRYVSLFLYALYALYLNNSWLIEYKVKAHTAICVLSPK